MEDMRLRSKPDYLSIEIGTLGLAEVVIEVNLHNKEIFGGAGVGLSIEPGASISITLGWVLHDPPWVEGESINRGRWISDTFLSGLSDNFSASMGFSGTGMTVVYDKERGLEHKAFEIGFSTPQAGVSRVYSINLTQFINDIYFYLNNSEFYDRHSLSMILNQKANYYIREEKQEKLGDFIRSPYYHA